jgi:hypothetical protein
MPFERLYLHEFEEKLPRSFVVTDATLLLFFLLRQISSFQG